MSENKLKSATIRYDAIHEKEIATLLVNTNEKTMNKAFLKAPVLIEEQKVKIHRMIKVIDDQRVEIEKMTSIVNSWKSFNEKLENFVNK